MAGIHRERPGAADLAAATDTPAMPLGNDIWMSPGVSNSYAVATDDGRVIVNAGLVFEGPLHRKAFADVAGPTRAIIITQGHADHWGGVNSLRDADTDVVMHRNYRYWRDDNERLMGYRVPKTSFAFQKFSDAMLEHFKTIDPATIDFSFPEPTTTFDRRHAMTVGGRTFELAWTPGGETTDSIVVWLPEERILFSGNLFGPLFGHVPNLMTIRGDRYRDPILYIESLNTVLTYGPRATDHRPLRSDRRRRSHRRGSHRDARRHASRARPHRRTDELRRLWFDVYTAMREVRVPEHLDVGEGYGKTSWNVRAIWEMYAGWFQHRSTTELYGVAPVSVAADVVQAAGADALVEAARAHVASGRPVQALHLTDLVLTAFPAHATARAVAADAHEALLADTENFWEKAWLTKSINELRTAA